MIGNVVGVLAVEVVVVVGLGDRWDREVGAGVWKDVRVCFVVVGCCGRGLVVLVSFLFDCSSSLSIRDWYTCRTTSIFNPNFCSAIRDQCTDEQICCAIHCFGSRCFLSPFRVEWVLDVSGKAAVYISLLSYTPLLPPLPPFPWPFD